MVILLLKALHIVGFVAWFGGLFYLVRILVYHSEAGEKADGERAIFRSQYDLMAQRAYTIICRPAMVFTWLCGLALLYAYGWAWFKVNIWMHFKLLFLFLLTGYHHYCQRMMIKARRRNLMLSSFQLRLLNEVPTVLLLAIVLLAVFKNMLNFAYAFLGVLAFGVILFIFARLYKIKREKHN